jgi:hypothetical protein
MARTLWILVDLQITISEAERFPRASVSQNANRTTHAINNDKVTAQNLGDGSRDEAGAAQLRTCGRCRNPPLPLELKLTIVHM